MNKELIEFLGKVKVHTHGDYALNYLYQGADLHIRNLQKAKEEQPKDVEEFYKKWSSDCRILPKEHEAIHSHEDLLRFAKDFANSRNEVTEEEKALNFLYREYLDYGLGYGFRKAQISKNTGIPLDLLTVYLKRLKIVGKIELIMIWSEVNGLPDGSGYCITEEGAKWVIEQLKK